MRAVIIGGGKITDIEFYRPLIKKNDYIICADSGYDSAVRMGIEPNIVIGDFDSVQADISDTKYIKYPAKKSMTDGEIAVEYAIEHGFDDIVMIGFIGCRIDHTLTNISFLEKIFNAGKNGVIIDEHNEIYFLKDKLSLSGKKGDIISVIPISDVVCGISNDKLEYPLDNENLYYNQSRGVSNVMLENVCTVTVKDGKALVIKSCD